MSQHFSAMQLVRYSLPSIAMALFSSIYGVIDGLFIANFVGTSAFAAVNIILPYVMIISVTGFMIGTGGSALVSKIRGEGQDARANEVFTQLVVFSAMLGVALAVIGFFTIEPVSIALGATGALLEICKTYGLILMLSLPFFTLQFAFQALFPTAGKPKLGLFIIVAAGVTNIVLDAIFIAGFGWGIEGAAIATVIGEILGGFIPLVYFCRKNSSLLKFTRFTWDIKSIGKACVNGMSEMVQNVSLSLILMAYNFQLMRYIGENGVAAYGIVFYAAMIFFPFFVGYNLATSPIVSYQFGARNNLEVRSLLKKGLGFSAIVGISMFLISELLADPISFMFSAGNVELYGITLHALRLGMLAFITCGICMYGSAFFTALNNGVISAFLSFATTLVFEMGAILLFPAIFGLDGIWYAWPVSTVLGAILSLSLIAAFRKRYGY